MMKTLGFSAQQPLCQAWQQDPMLVRSGKSKTFPAIQAEAKPAGAAICFADESGIRSDYPTGTTWALFFLPELVESFFRQPNVGIYTITF